MNELLLYLAIWSTTGALVVLCLSNMYPTWAVWKINIALILAGPVIWAFMLYYTLFVAKR